MKLNYLTVILIFFAARLLSQDADSIAFISLRPAEFREELDIVNRPVIIDVREFFEYRKKRVPGATNIPSGNIDAALDTLDKAGYYFLYCTGGFRSKRAAQKLADNHFIHVFNLEGGITEWKKEGFPVDRKKLKKRERARTQHPAPSTKHPTPSTQDPAPRTWHPAPVLQSSLYIFLKYRIQDLPQFLF